MRVKIVKDGKHKKGEILEVSKNEAFGLIDSGFAILSKDMVENDFKLKTPQTLNTKARKQNG